MAGEAKRRKAGDPTYGKRPKLGRGIVLSSPVHITEGRLASRGGQLDAHELRFALLFWDRIAWPHNPIIDYQGNSESHFLEQEGVLIRPRCRPQSGPVEKVFADAHIGAFLELESQERGCWSLSEGERTFLNELPTDLLVRDRGIAVELYRSIPIPTADVPLEDILEFRAARQPELLALRHEISDYSRLVVNSSDQDEVLQVQRERVEQACASVLRVTIERRLPFTISDFKFTSEIEVGKLAAGAVAGLIAAPVIGLPTIGAALAGFAIAAAGGLKVTAEFGLRTPVKKVDPFRYVYSLHEKIDWQ